MGLLTPNTNLGVVLGPDTAGTVIWAKKLLSKTTSRIERVKTAEEN